jgi:hypothetical protein
MFKIFIRELVGEYYLKPLAFFTNQSFNLDRGHQVTAITAFEFGEPLENYTELYIDPPYPLRQHCN